MSDRNFFLASLTRISDLDRATFDVDTQPFAKWETGDYVAVEVTGKPTPMYLIELCSGRMIDAVPGDRIIGALGRRVATLEGVGDWQSAGDDLQMHSLTSAGLFGKATSSSPLLPAFMTLDYLGHVKRDGGALNMRDFVPPGDDAGLRIPVVLLVGTSMSAGKTTTGRVVIRTLKERGLRVVGAKFTGAGRYRDILSFADAGADQVLDFVDVGLPSTAVPEAEFRQCIRQLIGRIARLDVDVAVIEAGASPLEPYNGSVAIEELGTSIHCTVLCASDPYAVVGVQTAFGLQPDLVSGPAANTEAGIELVRKLSGVDALNLMRPESIPRLAEVLAQRLA